MKNADNKLIAEFMGIEIDPVGLTSYDSKGRKRINEVDLEYETSWDWLMPVVEKIESFERTLVNIYSDATKIWVDDFDSNELFATTMSGNKDDKIGHVYRAVVEYIKWYNENKLES